jgi:beta-fructofuranosidase
VRFDLEKAALSVDRNDADGWSRGVSRSPLRLCGGEPLDICVYSDQSSVEVFTDNFRTVHSANIFAGNGQNGNYLVSEDGILFIRDLAAWGLETVMK